MLLQLRVRQLHAHVFFKYSANTPRLLLQRFIQTINFLYVASAPPAMNRSQSHDLRAASLRVTPVQRLFVRARIIRFIFQSRSRPSANYHAANFLLSSPNQTRSSRIPVRVRSANRCRPFQTQNLDEATSNSSAVPSPLQLNYAPAHPPAQKTFANRKRVARQYQRRRFGRPSTVRTSVSAGIALPS